MSRAAQIGLPLSGEVVRWWGPVNCDAKNQMMRTISSAMLLVTLLRGLAFKSHAATLPAMSAQQHEFTLAEFKALRDELIGHLDHMRQLEFRTILSMAVFYSFLFSFGRSPVTPTPSPQIPSWLWALPAAFPILALLRTRAVSSEVNFIAKYIRQIEVAYGRDITGWKNFIRDLPTQKFGVATNSHLLLSITLIAVSIAVFAWRVFSYS